MNKFYILGCILNCGAVFSAPQYYYASSPYTSSPYTYSPYTYSPYNYSPYTQTAQYTLTSPYTQVAPSLKYVQTLASPVLSAVPAVGNVKSAVDANAPRTVSTFNAPEPTFPLNNLQYIAPGREQSVRPVQPRLPASPGPRSDFAIRDPLQYAQLALANPIAVTAAIKAPRDATSPNAAAALAYMKAIAGDDICARSTEVYLQQVLNGATVDQANAEATAQYIRDYNNGLRVEPGSACEASDIAWRQAEAEGTDPVVASAIAFMENWPGTLAGNPCAVSGRDYVNAILEGSSHTQANLLAARSFGEAIKNLAAQGKELRDPACAAATRAYYAALPNKPSPPNGAAMLAFIDKAFAGARFDYDPVCWKSTLAFWDSYAAGKDELSSNLYAAEVFFDEFAKGGAGIPADSPCAAATRAYYANIPNPPSPPNKAAMEAFMDKMISGGVRQPDPVCAASTRAYWDAYKSGATETDANLAGAEAFFKAFAAGQGAGIPADSPCAAATKAYFNTLPVKPSTPNAKAMIAFMDAMIAQGNVRAYDPVCAASTLGFWEAYKNGADELTANFRAAQLFFEAYKQPGAKVPANSPCLISTRVYANEIRNKPSPPNFAAMIAFMDEAILTNMDRPDPVCLASAEAYFAAYSAGATEAKANEAAGVAFLDAVAATPDFNPGSPCGISAKAYMATFDLDLPF